MDPAQRSRILLLSGRTGAGHVMAARAVEGEFRRSGLSVTHLDAYAFVPAFYRWVYTSLHLNLLEFVPDWYGPLYERGSVSPTLARIQQGLTAQSRPAFARVLGQVRPAVVMATHALGCALAAPLKEAFGYRLVVLTTDYRAHAFQVHPAVDCYCASHELAAQDLRHAGIPDERVVVTGIPLRPQFDALPDRAAARRQLGLQADRPVVLVTRGGMAAGQETVGLLRALLGSPALASCQIVAVLGQRPRGYALVATQVPPSPRLRVERFVANMETYLAAADVVVGKAGGLSSTETFAAGRPLVIYAPNAGIEDANVARFVAVGAAINAGRSPARVVDAVREILGSPSQRAALVAAGRALVRPESRYALRAVVEALAARAPARATVPR